MALEQARWATMAKASEEAPVSIGREAMAEMDRTLRGKTEDDD